jgi:heparosan-N-sulfate-glucuronate 5-epimerase
MSLARHVRSALSHGVGYEDTPTNPSFDTQAIAGYYLDFSAKTTAPAAAEPGSLLPAALAQLALGWWELGLRGTDDAHARFVEVCDLLEATSTRAEGTALWLYRVPVRKYEINSEWASALAQGQAASVFVRAHVAGRDERHAELARAAVAPLLERGATSLVSRLPEGLVLEECPTQPPSAILNGWIYAAWGLRDVAFGLGSDDARVAYEAAIAGIRAALPRYDVGWWSRYSLYPHRLPDLAKVFYHRLHVAQLEMLERLAGDGAFGSVAERWRSYDTRWHRARLVSQKALFVASGYQ